VKSLLFLISHHIVHTHDQTVQGLHFDCRRVLKQHRSILHLLCSLNYCSLNYFIIQRAQEGGFVECKSIDTIAEACAGIRMHWLYLS